MVITQINAGLGNQMFQYAVARRFAVKRRQELRLDIDSYVIKPDETRPFCLDAFNICAGRISRAEVVRLFSPRYEDGKLASMELYDECRNINETVPSPLEGAEDVYFRGYWVNEMYFADIADLIRKDFTLKENLSPVGRDIAALIDGEKNTVSMHIRRGDYLEPYVRKVIGLCSFSYYQQAIDTLIEAFGKIKIFIFSDDVAWVKANCQGDYVLVSELVQDAAEEMVLMSLCEFHIIANSTFGWWGAWLDPRPGKIVIAPKPWYRDPQRNEKAATPPGWITLPANYD